MTRNSEYKVAVPLERRNSFFNIDDAEYEVHTPRQEPRFEGTFAGVRYAQKQGSSKVEYVVVTPKNANIRPGSSAENEVKRKAAFFKSMYPQRPPLYYQPQQGDYRLVLPYVPGVELSEIRSLTWPQFLTFFHTLLLQLKQLHNNGVVFIDLHNGNIKVDTNTWNAYLIDGGYCTPIGTTLNNCRLITRVMEQPSARDVVLSREEFPQFAPELHYVKGAIEPVNHSTERIIQVICTARKKTALKKINCNQPEINCGLCNQITSAVEHTGQYHTVTDIARIYCETTINQVAITPAQDVWAFGHLMQSTARKLQPLDSRYISQQLDLLLRRQCLFHRADQRPTIDDLIRTFQKYMQQHTQYLPQVQPNIAQAASATSATAPTTSLQWQPDDDRDTCTSCKKEFGILRRRHHCRKCLQLFCDDCTQGRVNHVQFQTHAPGSLTALKAVNQSCTGDLRVCQSCAKQLLAAKC